MTTIAQLSMLFGVLGALMLVFLFARVRAVDAEMNLKKHRSKDAGLADLLNYAAVVDDGVIVCKSGALMAAFMYRGPDNMSATGPEREANSARLNAALAPLGNGWMIHVDAVRRPSAEYPAPQASHFPDPVSEAIDEERRRYFQQLGASYEGYFVLTLTWFPPILAQQKFVELMFDDESKKPGKRRQTMALLEQFKRDVRNVENRLSSCLTLTRLKSNSVTQEDGTSITFDDFLSWLQYAVTGIRQPVVLPKNPMYLDAYIGGQEFWTGTVPKIGRKFVQVVAIEGFPLESEPGMLTALGELSCEYRWSSRYIFMDQHEALSQLEKYRKRWKQKIRGFFDQMFNQNSSNINQDAMSMTLDASEAMAEVSSGLVAAGYYTGNVVLYGENRPDVEADALRIAKAIARLGFVARIETINTVDAFLGSLPGHGVENVRRPLMNTMNLADLLPTSSIWTGNEFAPCPLYPAGSPPLMHCVTHGSTPFRLNLHVRDVGHTIVFGPTGSGKSTLLALIALQARRYRDLSLFVFDKGNSMYASTIAMGGDHYDIGGDRGGLSFAPLRFLETESDRAWAMGWLESILVLNGVASTPARRNAIATAVMSMHATGSGSITDFCLMVQDNEIREALAQYRLGGTMGHLLDAEQDSLSISSFINFEIDELMQMGDKYALPILQYLFRRIERSLKGQPAIIVLDECWLMLGHPVFAAKIREWLKTLRRANCLVIMATQSISDAANSGILDVIVEQTATKVFLPNPAATTEDATAIYKRMGLNERQIEIIGAATPKRHYYLSSERGNRLVDLALGPLALALIGASDRDALKQVNQLRDTFGADWIYEWFRIKKVDMSFFQREAA